MLINVFLKPRFIIKAEKIPIENFQFTPMLLGLIAV